MLWSEHEPLNGRRATVPRCRSAIRSEDSFLTMTVRDLTAKPLGDGDSRLRTWGRLVYGDHTFYATVVSSRLDPISPTLR